ncbi:Nca2p [Sporobolomyces koalae]|uniref:Nca2p n=1 Tax=Sporobolomyces koalae TaxID=500713 RepID=UPI00317B249D
MSYASDLTASLSAQLANVSPTLLRPSRSSSRANIAHLAPDDRDDADLSEARERQLRQTLSKLRPSSHAQATPGLHSSALTASTAAAPPLSAQTLLQLVDDTFPAFQADGTTPANRQTEALELITIAQLTIAAFGTILRTLMSDAAALDSDDDYWANAESDPLRTALFLVQTGPTRFVSLASITVSRLKQLTASTSTARPSLIELETWRRALPPSLFLTAVFPHLSGKSGLPSLSDLSTIGDDDVDGNVKQDPAAPTVATSSLSLSSATRLGRRTARSLFFLTLSPLALTRQEIADKRTSIRNSRQRLATKIGELTLTTANSELGSHLVNSQNAEERSDEVSLARLLTSVNPHGPIDFSLDEIRDSTWSTLRHLDSILSSEEQPTMAHMPTAPRVPADLAHSLSFLLSRTLPSHSTLFTRTTRELRKPRFVTRAWPYLLTIPLVTAVTARTIYNNRQSLWRYVVEAQETTKRFVLDWVVEPVRNILETVRGGETMALMGRDSLRSDLESLERMVVDFGRDEYHLSGPQLDQLAQQVRSGDLTSVLKAWEKDIKAPIRSAVGGSLIRTLLIQVQKVKVDVALAMDGIEKMLKSQQLTFGFVGVAPSMLIVVAFARWARNLTRSDGGAKRKAEERKKCWLVMRQLDLLLSPPRPSQTLSATTTQGLVLLSLSSLRTFAYSNQFPSRDTQLLAAFLEDVRALEDLGARAGKQERQVLVGRLRRWGQVLGWQDQIKA